MVLCFSRDVTVLKQFDESEIFWHLLFLLAEGDSFFKIIYIQDQFYDLGVSHAQDPLPPPPPLVWGWLRPCSSQCVLCFILVPRVLLNCLPIIHGLFSSILKFWEQCREPNTCDCPAQLYASVQMMSILRKAMWLPRPLCLGGDIFHIISPKEIHKLLETIWAFFKVSCVAS